MFWWFEDALKRRFGEFVSALETATHDSLVHVRSKVVRVAYDLVRSKAEQEQVRQKSLETAKRALEMSPTNELPAAGAAKEP